MQQGYTGPEVCKITGISYRQLDHWTTSSLIQASIRNLKGSGFHRIYSFQDIIQIKLVNKLREAGVSLQKIRIALKNIDSILGDNINISDVSVFFIFVLRCFSDCLSCFPICCRFVHICSYLFCVLFSMFVQSMSLFSFVLCSHIVVFSVIFNFVQVRFS